MTLEPKMVSLGWQVVVIVCLGIGLMLYLGWYGYKRRIALSLKDFFAGGKTIGFLILAFALFADAYSGNSFLGYAAKTYRAGAWFLVYPEFMIFGVIGLLIIVPPLINLATKWNYVSPLDFIEHRFNSKLVTFIVLVFMLWGTFVQYLEQFFAMGYLGEVSSGGVLPYQVVIVIFAVAILLYVTLGGYRGVVFTLCAQGAIMIFSLFMMIVLMGLLGGFETSINTLWQVAPKKLMLPSSAIMVTWYSTIILVMLGLPTYIHILQYYLGIRDAKNLRNMFRLLPIIFIFAPMVLWMVGLFGAGVFPGLSKLQSDKLVPYLMGALSLSHPAGTTISSFIALGVVMATLSTAGGAILVIGMILSKDLYRRFINPEAPEERVINMSRVIIGLFILLALIVAFYPRLTIWRWTEIKFELLLQATPPLVFGLYLHRVKKNPAIVGMIVGGIIAVALTLMGYSKVYGIHAGIIGFIINLLILILWSYATGEDEETQRAKEILEYNTIEITEKGETRYILPVKTRIFWAGLIGCLAIAVPWYAPKAWNSPSALALPIWSWVTIFAIAIVVLFAILITYKWHEE